jgi:hypothetical protein
VTDHCPFETTLVLDLGVEATDHHHHCGANMTLARDETAPHVVITVLLHRVVVVADTGATLTTVASCRHHTGDRIATTSERVAVRIIDDRITRAAGITIGANATKPRSLMIKCVLRCKLGKPHFTLSIL